MAVPTRPTQDAIIDPVWGQWVHDATVNKTLKWASVVGQAATFTNGRTTITAAMFGLPRIDGLTITMQATNAAVLFQVEGGLGTASVGLMGIYWVYTTAWASVPVELTGARSLNMFAWSATAPP